MRLLNLMNEIFFKWHIWAKCLMKRCQYVGRDAAGNQYYQEILKDSSWHPRRWVLYHGLPEATKVSAEWYNWLRHISATPPAGENPLRYSWQQPHLPNLTGTKKAYKTRSSKTQYQKYRSWISN
jgi:NADH:ubiquinone oxidoreductase subunit